MKLKLLIVVILFLIISKSSFAKDVAESQISGRVVDSQGNPIANSEIELTNESGSVSKAYTDFEGQYNVIVPNGTYSMSVEGPQGSDITSTVTNGQIISGETTRDFTLATKSLGGLEKEAKKPLSIQQIIIYVLIGLLLTIAAVSAYIYWKNSAKKSPKEENKSAENT